MRKSLPILLIISSLSASAIVVLHDVNDKKYLADTTDFAPLATLYVDGAHGTLIKPDWIVTAAHATFCISPGSYIRLNNGYHQVESVFVHKDYQPGKSHDIALIKLVNSINDVKSANLYEPTDELGKITAGEETLQQQLAFPKLERLPAVLTEQILPEVCADIRLKPNAI